MTATTASVHAVLDVGGRERRPLSVVRPRPPPPRCRRSRAGESNTSRGATPQRVRRSTNPEPQLRSGPVELVVGEPGDGFGTGPGVNPESAQVPVAALSLEHHRRRSTLSQMRQRRVTQLVQSPPTGVTAEQGSRGAVGEPGLAGRGVDVTAGGGLAGAGRW